LLFVLFFLLFVVNKDF